MSVKNCDPDLYGNRDNYSKLAHDLRVTVRTDNPRLRRALERQAQHRDMTVEEYAADSIAAMLVSDESQSILNYDGTIDQRSQIFS